MNYFGILHGFIAFVLIGAFHPLVIKGEYYLGRKCIRIFLATGVVALFGSMVTKHMTLSTFLGILSFCCFWSIKEVIEQEQRVREGRFPKNPKRMEKEQQNVKN
ncbi:DUF4491 family protein [Alkaliphilus oremlandii]|uniref:Putative membrane protein n=1 Tax=Alkaliphilus oremlandii (strain OhILAs) TaxID=350688 RepID=A8MM74_ALKOO|nr:DUF4491 family protein [Alkaliphilus oremlandii]ABW18241.1 putative membrane protein [Alkaliphilus oremlandii OhILAs]